MSQCNKVLTIPQYNETCWFNSILMVCLYSQNMRKLLSNKIKYINKKTKLHEIFIDIINSKFLEFNKGNFSYIYDKFKKNTPEQILQHLHDFNPELYNFTPFHDNEYNYISGSYIHKFLNFFSIPFHKILYLDQLQDKTFIISTQYYNDIFKLKPNNMSIIDFYNSNIYKKNLNNIKQIYKNLYDNYNSNNIDIVLINYLYSTTDEYHNYDELKNNNMFYKIPIRNIANTIKLKNSQFILDSMIISNFNYDECNMGHSIAGITCNNKRYLYNGWIKSSKDSSKKNPIYNDIPCALLKFDWFSTQNFSFCLNPEKCDITKLTPYHENLLLHNDLCFNVKKGENMHIFINKNSLNPTFIK